MASPSPKVMSQHYRPLLGISRATARPRLNTLRQVQALALYHLARHLTDRCHHNRRCRSSDAGSFSRLSNSDHTMHTTTNNWWCRSFPKDPHDSATALPYHQDSHSRPSRAPLDCTASHSVASHAPDQPTHSQTASASSRAYQTTQSSKARSWCKSLSLADSTFRGNSARKSPGCHQGFALRHPLRLVTSNLDCANNRSPDLPHGRRRPILLSGRVQTEWYRQY